MESTKDLISQNGIVYTVPMKMYSIYVRDVVETGCYLTKEKYDGANKRENRTRAPNKVMGNQEKRQPAKN